MDFYPDEQKIIKLKAELFDLQLENNQLRSNIKLKLDQLNEELKKEREWKQQKL